MRGYEVMHLLGSPYSSSLFELEVNKLYIKPANELSLHWSRFDNIKEENGGPVSFGNCSRNKQGKRLSYSIQLHILDICSVIDHDFYYQKSTSMFGSGLTV